MRIDLTTAYAERHVAKALGARWDAFSRVWYLVDPEDLTPFLRWIPSVLEASEVAGQVPNFSHITQPPIQNKPASRAYGVTGPAVVPHCGCEVLPWNKCMHTAYDLSTKP